MPGRAGTEMPFCHDHHLLFTRPGGSTATLEPHSEVAGVGGGERGRERRERERESAQEPTHGQAWGSAFIGIRDAGPGFCRLILYC